MAIKHLSDSNPDGTLLGQATTDKIGFFGTAPTVQATLTALATGATIATVVSSVQEIIAELQAKGFAG